MKLARGTILEVLTVLKCFGAKHLNSLKVLWKFGATHLSLRHYYTVIYKNSKYSALTMAGRPQAPRVISNNVMTVNML